MKKHILITGFLLWAVALAAQPDNRQAALGILHQLTRHYAQTPLLSFDVLYRYSSEQAPGVYMDSLRGSCKMDGERYWYLLDSTETVCTGKLIVVLYREDKLMYLSAPSPQTAGSNPIALPDSFLTKKEGIQYDIIHVGDETTVIIQFGKGYTYKRVEYHIDDKTGLLNRMVSVVKSEQLYDPTVRNVITPADSYALVEAVFSHYRQKEFDTGVFETSRYCTKESGSYTTTAAYNQYKIFLGKTGL